MPYQMKNGKWRAKKMINGVLKTHVFTTKTEAKKWEAEQSLEDWQAKTATICLIDAANAYLDYSQTRHHKTTYEAKKLALQRFFHYVRPQDTPEKFTPKLALKCIMDRAQESSNAAANKDRKHLAAFWEHAIKFYGFPKENPFRLVQKLPENSQPHYVPPLEDFWKVYAVADDVDKTMLLSLLYTAGRRSEPMRWKWDEDIDLKNKRIRLSTCKTADGSRKYEWMPMPPKLYEALVNHKMQTGGHGYVFVSKITGECYQNRKHFITRLCDRAGVKRFNFHGIRGLCATLLAAEGVSMKEIQTVLMHANMTTTDRYVRRIGGMSDRLLVAFEHFEGQKTASKIIPFEAVSK